MTVPKPVLWVILIVLAAAAPARAQAPGGPARPPSRVQGSIGLLFGGPVGDFGRRVDGAGGLSAQLDVGLGASPVSVGGEAAYLWYGSESRDLDLGAVIPEPCSDISATNLDDYTASYGVGGGVLMDLGSPGGFRLDVSTRYLRGGEANYLTEGAIHRVGGQAVLDVSRSSTDMVLMYVGITFGR